MILEAVFYAAVGSVHMQACTGPSPQESAAEEELNHQLARKFLLRRTPQPVDPATPFSRHMYTKTINVNGLALHLPFVEPHPIK